MKFYGVFVGLNQYADTSLPRLLYAEDDARSLYDYFGFEWTLLRLGPAPPRAERVIGAARRCGLQLEVVDVRAKEALDLYEAPLALIRPDQVVAWRGFGDRDAEAVVAAATGAAP